MIDNPCVWTIVVAAGSGRRFGGDKLAAVVKHPSTTVRDLAIEQAVAASDGVVVVVSVDHSPRVEHSGVRLRVMAGGDTRTESVRKGLAGVPANADVVLVHDAARPLADAALFRRVVEAVAAGASAAIPVVPVVDTVRTTDGAVPDRDSLRAVQTPQAFDAAVLRQAHAAGGEATDDAALVESLGYSVVLVEGDVRNLKVTQPVDIDIVRALQQEQ